MGIYELRTKVVPLEDKGHKYEFEIRELTGRLGNRATDKSKQVVANIGEQATVTMSMELYDIERMKLSVVSAKCDGKTFDFGKEIDSMPQRLSIALTNEINRINSLTEKDAKNSERQSEGKSPTPNLPQNTPSQ
jgi:hypothetical protein